MELILAILTPFVQVIGLAIIFGIVELIRWAIGKHNEVELKKTWLEAEAKAQQKAREEQFKKSQLESSVKYSKLKELFEALKPYREAIVLKLNTPAEFDKYNKILALDVAYNEISSKYKFLNDNHFSDKLRNILAMP